MKYKLRESFFLGQKLKTKAPVRVIGAGIAGLLTGYYLRRAGYDFEIVEKAGHTGGLLGTRVLQQGLAEQAANGFIWTEALQNLADDLNLKIIAPKATAKKRFLIRNGKLRRFPLSLSETLVMGGKMLWPHPKTLETAADFGDTYFGASFSRQLLGPGLAGIYGADPEQLSFPGALARVAKILNHSDSLPLALFKNNRETSAPKTPGTKKATGTHGFENGMGQLVDALTEHLQDHLRLSTDGAMYRNSTDHQIITTPAYVSQHFFEGELATMLKQVEYTPLVSATLIFDRSQLRRFPDGFGCLIPRNENYSILGVLFNSCIFPKRTDHPEKISLTCILREDQQVPYLLQRSDEAILQLICGDLDRLFGLKGFPLERALFRWPQAIPIYSPQLYGHWWEMDRLLQEDYPHRQLFGNYTGQIAIRGMCEAAAAELAWD